MVDKIIEYNNNKQDLEYKLKKEEDSSVDTNRKDTKQNNKTLDKIVKEEQTQENYHSKRLSDYDRTQIFDLYNSRKDIRVKDIAKEFNKNREKNGSKTKNFCVSTLYNILNKYEKQGKTVRWRRKKKKQNTAIKPNYYKNVFGNYLAKTGNFFKKNIKKIVSYGLVGVLSFMIGFGASNYTPKLPKDYPITPPNKVEYVIEKGDSLWNLMDKETGRPDLWEIVYAANERPATTKIQKDRQHNLREIGYKYDIECLKDVGQKGSLKPYEFKDQYKIRDNTKININKGILKDIVKLSPVVESEFNKVFYKSQ